MSMRENQVEAAVRFLKNPVVADKSATEKQDFLVKKGLTQEEIAEAIKRASGDSSSAGSSASTAPTPTTAAPATASVAAAPVAPPPAATAAPGGYPPAAGSTLPGGYPAPPSSNLPGGYPAPAGVAPVPAAGYGLAPYPGMMALPPAAWPPPMAPQASSLPWFAWLLGGLGFGSLIALLANLLWPRRPRQPALAVNAGMMPAQAQHAAWQQQQLQAFPVRDANGTVHFVTPSGIPGAMPALLPPPIVGAEALPAEDADEKSGGANGVVRMDELAGYVRRHVEETREATGALRRTLELQQRQYQTALSDFQRKVEEASKRKPSSTLPRMEIAPESMKMLKSLIQPAVTSNGSMEEGGDALRQWVAQVDQALQRLLLASPCKAEAKKSLQTVSLIVSNLVSTSAQQEKYRDVNTSSDRFKKDIGSPDGGAAELLQLAGFERREADFVFPSDGSQGLDKAERVRDFLQAALRDCDQRWDQTHGDGGGGTALPSTPPPGEPLAVQDVSEAPPARPVREAQKASSFSGAGAPAPPAVSSGLPSMNSSTQAAASSSTAPLGEASSSRASPAARPPAPWLSSVQRGLSRMPNGTAEGTPEAGAGGIAAAHPAESAGVEEEQRAPG